MTKAFKNKDLWTERVPASTVELIAVVEKHRASWEAFSYDKLRRKLEEIANGFLPRPATKNWSFPTSQRVYHWGSSKKGVTRIEFGLARAISLLPFGIDVTKAKVLDRKEVVPRDLVSVKCALNLNNEGKFYLQVDELAFSRDNMPVESNSGDYLGRIYFQAASANMSLVANNLKILRSFEDGESLNQYPKVNAYGSNISVEQFGISERNWLITSSDDSPLRGTTSIGALATLDGEPKFGDEIVVSCKMSDIVPRFVANENLQTQSIGHASMRDLVVEGLSKRGDRYVFARSMPLKD